MFAITTKELSQELNRLETENFQLKAALAATRKQLVNLTRCKTFDILTRQGLELEWERFAVGYPAYDVIFFDIDGLKGLNESLGYTGANRLIKQAFSCVRSSELVGRWFSGDEFVCIVVGCQSSRVHERLKASFASHGLTFTSAVGQCLSADLEECVASIAAEVQRLKSFQKGVGQ